MTSPSDIITSAAVPLSNADQVISMVSDLQKQLQTQSPGYESLLHKIHVILSKNEDITYLLSEEQIGVIVAGLSKKKNVVLAENAGKKKSMKNISLDDL